MEQYLQLLVIMAFAIGLSTVVGAVAGLLLRKIPHRYHDMILGTAAGIMLAAAVLGLILPAAEMELPGALWMTSGHCLSAFWTGSRRICTTLQGWIIRRKNNMRHPGA